MPNDDDIGSAATVGTSDPSVSTTLAPASPPPSLLANRYEILGLLGIGGMGRVYRAHDRSLDETIALKMLRRELIDAPGRLERFRKEVKLARRVTNPHVVRTFDLGERATARGFASSSRLSRSEPTPCSPRCTLGWPS